MSSKKICSLIFLFIIFQNFFCCDFLILRNPGNAVSSFAKFLRGGWEIIEWKNFFKAGITIFYGHVLSKVFCEHLNQYNLYCYEDKINEEKNCKKDLSGALKFYTEKVNHRINFALCLVKFLYESEKFLINQNQLIAKKPCVLMPNKFLTEEQENSFFLQKSNEQQQLLSSNNNKVLESRQKEQGELFNNSDELKKSPNNNECQIFCKSCALRHNFYYELIQHNDDDDDTCKNNNLFIRRENYFIACNNLQKEFFTDNTTKKYPLDSPDSQALERCKKNYKLFLDSAKKIGIDANKLSFLQSPERSLKFCNWALQQTFFSLTPKIFITYGLWYLLKSLHPNISEFLKKKYTLMKEGLSFCKNNIAPLFIPLPLSMLQMTWEPIVWINVITNGKEIKTNIGMILFKMMGEKLCTICEGLCSKTFSLFFTGKNLYKTVLTGILAKYLFGLFTPEDSNFFKCSDDSCQKKHFVSDDEIKKLLQPVKLIPDDKSIVVLDQQNQLSSQSHFPFVLSKFSNFFREHKETMRIPSKKLRLASSLLASYAIQRLFFKCILPAAQQTVSKAFSFLTLSTAGLTMFSGLTGVSGIGILKTFIPRELSDLFALIGGKSITGKLSGISSVFANLFKNKKNSPQENANNKKKEEEEINLEKEQDQSKSNSKIENNELLQEYNGNNSNNDSREDKKNLLEMLNNRNESQENSPTSMIIQNDSLPSSQNLDSQMNPNKSSEKKLSRKNSNASIKDIIEQIDSNQKRDTTSLDKLEISQIQSQNNSTDNFLQNNDNQQNNNMKIENKTTEQIPLPSSQNLNSKKNQQDNNISQIKDSQISPILPSKENSQKNDNKPDNATLNASTIINQIAEARSDSNNQNSLLVQPIINQEHQNNISIVAEQKPNNQESQAIVDQIIKHNDQNSLLNNSNISLIDQHIKDNSKDNSDDQQKQDSFSQKNNLEKILNNETQLPHQRLESLNMSSMNSNQASAALSASTPSQIVKIYKTKMLPNEFKFKKKLTATETGMCNKNNNFAIEKEASSCTPLVSMAEEAETEKAKKKSISPQSSKPNSLQNSKIKSNNDLENEKYLIEMAIVTENKRSKKKGSFTADAIKTENVAQSTETEIEQKNNSTEIPNQKTLDDDQHFWITTTSHASEATLSENKNNLVESQEKMKQENGENYFITTAIHASENKSNLLTQGKKEESPVTTIANVERSTATEAERQENNKNETIETNNKLIEQKNNSAEIPDKKILDEKGLDGLFFQTIQSKMQDNHSFNIFLDGFKTYQSVYYGIPLGANILPISPHLATVDLFQYSPRPAINFIQIQFQYNSLQVNMIQNFLQKTFFSFNVNDLNLEKLLEFLFYYKYYPAINSSTIENLVDLVKIDPKDILENILLSFLPKQNLIIEKLLENTPILLRKEDSSFAAINYFGFLGFLARDKNFSCTFSDERFAFFTNEFTKIVLKQFKLVGKKDPNIKKTMLGAMKNEAEIKFNYMKYSKNCALPYTEILKKREKLFPLCSKI